MELDSSLKTMGVSGITQEEAIFLVNTLLSTPGTEREEREKEKNDLEKRHKRTHQKNAAEFEAQNKKIIFIN
jgi:hypothetical protein